ncbi:MAG TPA: hypothetical protein VLB09_03900 [Nitrospiria bacterium]|nr:hypothetical protein [Nitrospiria bacterium]
MDGTSGADWNMAVDEAISQSCRENLSPPTLRFYRWNRPSVTIGRFQKSTPPPLPVLSMQPDIPVIRRITGGAAVLHDQDLTFSFSAGRVSEGEGNSGIPERPRESFLFSTRCIRAAMTGLGLETRWGSLTPAGGSQGGDCFSQPASFELLFRGEKILGCAQRQWKTGLLQQGSIRLSLLEDVLPPEALNDGGHLLGLRIKAEFERAANVRLVLSKLSLREEERSQILIRDKYSQPTWNRHGAKGKPVVHTIDNSLNSARI